LRYHVGSLDLHRLREMLSPAFPLCRSHC